jgi:hypothetical protein
MTSARIKERLPAVEGEETDVLNEAGHSRVRCCLAKLGRFVGTDTGFRVEVDPLLDLNFD